MGIDENTELTGTPGKYNILAGLKKLIYSKNQEEEQAKQAQLKTQIVENDQAIANFDKFLREQDKTILAKKEV